jgi:TetR/AcrR family transcriptional regulator, transcriptional repressor for nem operon
MSKGELTRQRIIEQAAPLFNQRGFHGCSMQDVMTVTGLEKGGLYRHFSGKEELAGEAFLYALQQVIKVRTDGMEHLSGTVARLKFLIHRFVDTPSPIPGGCPLLNTAVDADDGSVLLRKLVRKAFADWRKRLSAIVAEGIEAGEIRQDMNPVQVANTIIAALEGGLVLSRAEGNREPLQHAEASLYLLLDQMSSVARRPRPGRTKTAKG